MVEIEIWNSLIYMVVIVLGAGIWKIIFRKRNNVMLETVLVTVVGLLLLAFVSPGYMYKTFVGSIVTIDFFQVIAAVTAIWAIQYVKLQLSDYIILVVGIFMMKQYYYGDVYGEGLLLCGSFSLLCIVTRSCYGKLKELSLQIDLSLLGAAFVYIFYEVLYEKGLRGVYYGIAMGYERYQKVVIVALMALLVLGVTFVLIACLKHLFHLYVVQLQEFSEKYAEIGYYLLGIPCFVVVLLLFMDGLSMELIWLKSQMIFWKFAVILLFVGTQIFYIKLLMTTIHLKERIKYQETEQDNLMLYQQDFRENMEDIREAKHDMKNIFLTMGEYVKRSQDKEFQTYYAEKIAPYARNEMQMNDIYVRLQDIQNESVKAFLYYKILQCKEEKVVVLLKTTLDHSLLPYMTDSSTILRILGIFLDNAIEESRQQEENGVYIQITESQNQANFMVKNKVRESVRQQGIHIGTTDKGLGRGNGLKIVAKLIKKHSDIIWNSYFQENEYVQSITITRTIIKHKNAQT
ncbi:MAG: GHKL domain-containing protein [Lachnospiraceae bacterium]